jgi:outer membrane protein assembly factor BamB
MSVQRFATTLCSQVLLLTLLWQGQRGSAANFSPALDFGPRERERLPFFSKERPYKLGAWVLSRNLDREKPLASVISPGMSLSKDVLVVAYDQEWVGGFSVSKHKNLWWYKSNGGLTAPPTISGDAVILGFRDGSVHKVDLLSGQKVWDTRLDTFPAREIAIHDNQLLIVTASQSLHNVDFASGRSKWLFDGGSPDFLTIRTLAAPTVNRGTVYFGIASGEVLGVDLASGKEVLRVNPDPTPSRFRDVVGPLYVAAADKLLVSRSDGLVSCLYTDGAKKGSSCWEKPLHSDGITATHFAEGTLFIGTFNGYISAIAAQQGKKLWQQDTNGTISSLTLSKGTLYSSTTKGKITALVAADGTYRWSDHLESLVTSAPVMSEEGIYFLTGQNSIYGYRL